MNWCAINLKIKDIWNENISDGKRNCQRYIGDGKINVLKTVRGDPCEEWQFMDGKRSICINWHGREMSRAEDITWEDIFQ